MLLCAFPLAFALVLLLLPLWRWIEATFAVESIGHSGPAAWCFWLIYVLLAGAIVLMRRPHRHTRR
ncbi:MAG TPA: hypothetical protein VIS52_01090 [Motiliproteus sp.]